ncbi:hypothetical protein DMI62_03385 [Escherichia coli]|nr:hypothetical protein [Escherichia coli]
MKIFAEGIQCDENSWHNLSSGGKVRNWRWLYCVLYNVMSKRWSRGAVAIYDGEAYCTANTGGLTRPRRFRPENQDAGNI